ncbi:MAG: LeoA/HP0731 family dynamin-like GTPase, partial [Suipraeoptans sp.]
LVFVITNELFDAHLAQHFRELSIERDKAAEMILVVNKIERGGNTRERQDTIRDDLRKVTAPYTPEDMRISFVSAESYIDGLTEEDEEIAEELLERSGYNRFIETLNKFIQEKNIPARLTTTLYKIDEVLQDAIKQLQPSSGDSDIDALEERYLQERHILPDNRRRIEQRVENIYTEATANIRNEGIKASNLIVSDAKEDEVQEGLEKATQKVDSIAKQCEVDVQEKIKNLVGECDSELGQLSNSEFSKKLDSRLLEKKDSLPPQIKKFLKSDALNNAGKFVAENAYRPGVATNATKLASFSESTVHSAVKTIGHFFGHKFKPWEAVKITKGIAVAGKSLSILGVVFQVGMQVKEDIDTQRVEDEMRSNRENIRSGFNEAARELEKHFVNALRNFIEAEFDSRISQVDEKIDEIRSLRKNKNENCLRLEAVLKENRQLIREIHKANG